MANPVYPQACTKNAWTKVATNVTTGVLHIKQSGVRYLSTYRMTGVAAPTEKAEGAPMFIENPYREYISASAGIDVYVWADGDIDGVLRVDL